MKMALGAMRLKWRTIVTHGAPCRAKFLAVALLLSAVLSLVIIGAPSAEAESPTTFTAVSVGGGQTCALTSGGDVECWGDDTYGQLGNNSAMNSSVPVAVSGLSTGVSVVTAGSDQSCALTSGGGVECWGISSGVPVAVSGLSSGVSAISGLGPYACALTSDGGVQCWGSNQFGNLGNGTTTSSSVPVAVSGLSNGVIAISAGLSHACALTSGGAVECWGLNNFGQLGDGTSTGPQPACSAAGTNQTDPCSETPVAVSGLSSGVSAISANGEETCALTSGGSVECWGLNNDGQLGDGTTTNSSVPVAVSGLASGVTAISSGYDQTCALTSGGAVECWGGNADGELGNGTTSNSLVPVAVSGLSGRVTAISAGGAGYGGETCALTSGGAVECWGLNNDGQLGNGTTTNSSVPVTVLPPPTTAVVIPTNGATVSGSSSLLDASSSPNVKAVTYELSGGTLNDQVVATGTPTYYGWLAEWNTTTVPNGTYTLQSVGSYSSGESGPSAGITVTVDNPPPTTAVVIPTNGATVSGSSSLLDASSSPNVKAVTYELSGGTLNDQVVATGTPTYYGWLAEWNTTTVPNGTYTLQSVGSYSSGESGPSAGITVTVSN